MSDAHHMILMGRQQFLILKTGLIDIINHAHICWVKNLKTFKAVFCMSEQEEAEEAMLCLAI